MDGLSMQFEEWLEKALGHLEYSVRKLQRVKPIVATMDDEELETWEGLVSRFARASDLFFTKVLRKQLLDADPGFRGTFVDMLNQAEKFGWISDVNTWKRIRELRNVTVHEYAGDTINRDLEEIRDLSLHLLALRRRS